MANPSVVAAIIALAVGAASPRGANAALFEFKFAGVIALVEGTVQPPFDVVVTGDTFEYVAIVDTLAATSAIPSFYGVGAGTHYNGLIEAGLTVGGVNVPMGPLPPGFEGSVFVSNDAVGTDIFAIFGHVPGAIQIGVLMLDDDLLALADESIPTTLSPHWDPHQSVMAISFGDSLLNATGRAIGVIQSSSVREVPAPAGTALALAGGIWASRRRRH